MANHKNTLKAIRKTEKVTDRNRDRRSRVRSFLKKVEQAVEAGNQSDARDALRAAESEIARAAGKGVFKQNTAARKISRLSARVKKIAA